MDEVLCKLACKKGSEGTSFCSHPIQDADIPVLWMETYKRPAFYRSRTDACFMKKKPEGMPEPAFKVVKRLLPELF
jgi:hypothetical protein